MQEAVLNFGTLTAMKCDLGYVKYKRFNSQSAFIRETNERFQSRGTFLYKMRNVEPWDCKTAALFNLVTTDYLGFLKKISLELRPKVRLSNLVPFNAPSGSEKKVISVILLYCSKAKNEGWTLGNHRDTWFRSSLLSAKSHKGTYLSNYKEPV